MASEAHSSTQKSSQTTIAAPQPLVSLQRGAQRPPQDLPNLMSHLKPSTSPSPILALPSAGPSKPSSTTPVVIEAQSTRHADLLAELGIKVRDFAYESKLPPVQPYRVRQIQPWLRPLKRTRRDGEEVDDVFQENVRIETAEGSSSRRSRLKREGTEADITQLRRPHNLGYFVNSCDHHSEYSPSYQSQSQPSNHSQLFPSPPVPDPYDVTPPVTPNGSIVWPDTIINNEIPRLQLDTESQASDVVLLTSPLDMSEPKPEFPDPTGTGLVGTLTPMSSLSSVGSDVPPEVLDSFTLSRSPTVSPTPTEPATPPPSSRYQLRRRPIPHNPLKSDLLHSKTLYKAVYPLHRPGSYPMQASHSKAKASLRRVAPTHGSPSNCDETMIVR
ncbi:hypothetical protein C0993_003022 [Termitomyces sp. T159_Od127]|nr:hypothetical protein C0993_003022 [Termitomyces sp. T159_Od127]